MAQATMLGLCTDNIVTILTPSSTIESPLGPLGDAAVNGNGTLTFGTPQPLQIPTDNLYIVFGSISIPAITDTVTISISSFIWSQAVTGAMSVPFQTICRGSPTLLVTATSTVTTAPYTYTATTLR
jgi:hypothetical protein